MSRSSAQRRPPETRSNKKLPNGFQTPYNTHLCQACNVVIEGKKSFEHHLGSLMHEQNYALFMFEKHRTRKIKDRHKMLVKAKCDNKWLEHDKKGIMLKQINPESRQLDYTFELVNNGEVPIVLHKISLLHPYPAFTVSDVHNVCSSTTLVRIQPGCCYRVKVLFLNRGRGTYEVPVAFKFIRLKDEVEKDFDIVRVIAVKVRGTEYPLMESDDTEPSPFRGDIWTNVKFGIPGMTRNGKPLKFQTPWEIPSEYYNLLHNWLLPWDGIIREEMSLLTRVFVADSCGIPVNCTDIALRGYEKLKEHYEFLMHMLLYLEEYDASVHVNRYNMRGVTLSPSVTPERLELKVPGLAEKRPSLLKNDLIYCRVRWDDGQTEEVEYEGQIVEVREKSVIISHFNPEFYNRMFSESLVLDVRFSFSRYPISVMHCAVHNIVGQGLMNVIFPGVDKCSPSLVKSDIKLEFCNEEVMNNKEQRQAVLNILKGNCRPAPYIIFGPPGTGKTVTVVESILQIRKVFPQSRILVCAPSNAACDLVASRLVPFFKPSELLRLHSSTREWATVPECLHKFSNRSENLYYSPTPKELVKYRVVVCTLISCKKLSPKTERDSQYEEKITFSHIFIDECGQALEPEALVPLGLVLSPFNMQRPSGIVVLAGDPCQLGPVCNSKRAENISSQLFDSAEPTENFDDITKLNRRMGLGISLLERLMVTCSLYKKDAVGNYNNQFITKLLKNFRSHPDIIDLPNKLFYSGELIPSCPDEVRLDPIYSKILPCNGKPVQPCAVVFHGVLGQEKREGRSPSYFNRYEADQVLNYVKLLLDPSSDIRVKPCDIGIIAPYIRQVYKIKHALEELKLDEVEVGTTETFQGREKRVIIISTVRANSNLLDFDYRFRLGFVADPKRFNVAVTRAKSLLIVVGNPYQLILDSNWQKLINFCQDRGSYLGSSYKPRNEQWWDHVILAINSLSQRD